MYGPYTRITSNDMKENDKRLHQACDSTLPFENILDQIEDSVDFLLREIHLIPQEKL